MAGTGEKPSRIRDVDRDSKILRGIPSKPYPLFDTFSSESKRVLDGLRHHLNYDHRRVGQDLPRTTEDGAAAGFHQQSYSIRKTNKRWTYDGFTSSFNKDDNGFHGCKEMEDPFHGFYRRHGGLIDKFKKNLPDFDGFWHPEDLMSWIDAIEDFFEEINPPEPVKCNIVWYKMKGAAYYWWKILQNDKLAEGKNLVTSWPRMRGLLICRFAPRKCLMKCPLDIHGCNLQENEADLTHAKCSTKVPFEAYVNKEDEENDPRPCGIFGLNHEENDFETSKKSAPFTNIMEESEPEYMLSNKKQCVEAVALTCPNSENIKVDKKPIDNLIEAESIELEGQTDIMFGLVKISVFEDPKGGVEHEATNVTKAVNVGSEVRDVSNVLKVVTDDFQLGNAFPSIKEVVKVGPNEVDFLVDEMLKLSFDPGGDSPSPTFEPLQHLVFNYGKYLGPTAFVGSCMLDLFRNKKQEAIGDSGILDESGIIHENSGIKTLVKSGLFKPTIDGMIGPRVIEMQPISFVATCVLMKEIPVMDQKARTKHGFDGKRSLNSSRSGEESGCVIKVGNAKEEQSRIRRLSEPYFMNGCTLYFNFDPGGDSCHVRRFEITADLVFCKNAHAIIGSCDMQEGSDYVAEKLNLVHKVAPMDSTKLHIGAKVQPVLLKRVAEATTDQIACYIVGGVSSKAGMLVSVITMANYLDLSCVKASVALDRELKISKGKRSILKEKLHLEYLSKRNHRYLDPNTVSYLTYVEEGVVMSTCRFAPTSVDAYLTPFIKAYLYGFLFKFTELLTVRWSLSGHGTSLPLVFMCASTEVPLQNVKQRELTYCLTRPGILMNCVDFSPYDSVHEILTEACWTKLLRHLPNVLMPIIFSFDPGGSHIFQNLGFYFLPNYCILFKYEIMSEEKADAIRLGDLNLSLDNSYTKLKLEKFSIIQAEKWRIILTLPCGNLKILVFGEDDNMVAGDGLQPLHVGLLFHTLISFDPGDIACFLITWMSDFFADALIELETKYGEKGLAYIHDNNRLHQGLGPSSVFTNLTIERDAALLSQKPLFQKLQTLAFLVDVRFSNFVNGNLVEKSSVSVHELTIGYLSWIFVGYTALSSHKNIKEGSLTLKSTCVLIITAILEEFTIDLQYMIVIGFSLLKSTCIQQPGEWNLLPDLLIQLKANCFLFQPMWHPGFYGQMDTDPNLTRGRVIQWERWNTVGKYVIGKLSVVGLSSCSKILCEQRQFKNILKLFHKLVNGLDPPKEFMASFGDATSVSNVQHFLTLLSCTCSITG